MKSYRSGLQVSSIVLLALSTAACLPESDDDSSSSSLLSVTITSPGAGEIDTTDTRISVAGTASSDTTISSISWNNDAGGEGMATGIENWQTQNIELQLGVNTITVTASDDAGHVGTDKLIVNRENPEKGAATLSWDAPGQRTDGSPLTDLSGFRIYYGRMSEIYDYEVDIDNPGVLTYMVENLVPGDWYFAVAAYDSTGLESGLSGEAHKKIL